ncbi:hypothetical protein BC_0741 [Bacillus cereus ATCC 14579]|uniref:Uncharacterized protein n=1 Tax=Bacillus cereus (strain ATCC 14579 / DSM 31 / CCUG 7414 / JCM 2152 / NBRC 15305 / NCIMB 9373 / NCTC 2599 / NRRL B-3711) TaxID=226900 RepID=Q81HR3_BACCR|nr:hypothetical protein BC_0741 [Bacillus cereus ATCC 14579]
MFHFPSLVLPRSGVVRVKDYSSLSKSSTPSGFNMKFSNKKAPFLYAKKRGLIVSVRIASLR